MLFKKQHKFDNYSTIIGENTVLVSDVLKGEGSVRIDRKYKGDIFLDSDLVIGEKGIVEGSVQVENIEVAGIVIGDIISKDLVHLTADSKVRGNVTCSSLVIDYGASISGCCIAGNPSESSINSNPNITDLKTDTSI